MLGSASILHYLWLIILTLMICLVGVGVLAGARRLYWLWWRRGPGLPGRSRKGGADGDPWKASGERLIVPMPLAGDSFPHIDEDDDDDD